MRLLAMSLIATGYLCCNSENGSYVFPVVGFHSLMSAAFTSHWKGLDHNQRWFEVDASYLGAKHFDKHYGRGKKDFVYGDERFFDINAFRNGLKTSYLNPRTGWNMDVHYPTSGARLNEWDFIF